MSKKNSGMSKKSEQKLQNKIIEDKTFGLKNKNKSKVVQEYVKSVENNVKKGGKSQQSLINEDFENRALKKKLKEEEAFLNSLTNSIKVIKQTDCEDDLKKKNIICQFILETGRCDDKDCKYSHDMNLEFNQGQVDIYTDLREVKAKLGIDYEMMEQIESKRSKLPKTDIVCKFFLSSIKDKTYGYKWQCPNGDECHYKHCLPKDFIIKKMQGIGAQEEMTFEEFHDLEEKIDLERERVSLNGTKVTEKTLAIWLEKRKKEKMSDIGQKKREEMMKLLKTGRELFSTNKDTFKDDENADDEVYENQNNEFEEETQSLQNQLWNNKSEDVKVDENLFKNEDLDAINEIDLDDENEEENNENKEEEQDP